MAVKKLPVRKLVLVLAFIIVIVGIVAALIWQGSPRGQQGKDWGQRPGGKEESYDFKVPGTPPEPPSGKVSVYKGFWMPASFYYDHKGQSMSDAKDLVAAGANIASIAPNIRINAKGEVKFDAPFDYMEQALAYWAKNYYEKGIRISLVIEVSYQDDLNLRPNKAPEGVPHDIASRPGFLDKYNKIVIETAKLAEKYHVEMFSPMNEPDLKLGDVTASSWGQGILPEIKKYYHGKILWKAAGSDGKQAVIDFSGYDILGFDPTPGGGGNPETVLAQYHTQLRKMIELAKARAKKYNVPEVMITEFGVWGGALSFNEENKMLAHRIVFEEGEGKVSGFIALDPPSDLDRGLLGTLSLEEITKWFKKL
jgi:hypothetical protein